MKIVDYTIDRYDEVEKLWVTSFPEDEKEFFEVYMKTTHKKGKTILLIDEKRKDEILCMLTTINKEMVLNGKSYHTVLIEGIATPKRHRRKGYMRKLLNHVIREEKKSSELIIIQAYEPDTYKGFGFKETHYLKTGKVKFSRTTNIDPNNDPVNLLHIWNKYIKDKDGYHKRTESDFEDYVKQVQATNGHFIQNKGAYICVWNNTVHEFAYSKKEDLLKLICDLDGELGVAMAESETIFDDVLTDVKRVNNTMLLLFNKKIELKNDLYFPEFV